MTPITCIPMKELKNTAAFTEVVQSSPSPIIVTKNGSSAFVSMSVDYYESLLEEAARSRLYLEVDKAEANIATGNTQDAYEALRQFRANYNL